MPSEDELRELNPTPDEPDPDASLEDETKAALDRLRAEAMGVGEEIAEDLLGEAAPALDIDAIPEIAHSKNFETALRNTLVYGERLVKEQAAFAIRNLREVSEEAAKEGVLILEQLARVGLSLANAEITPDTASQATENLLSSLELVALRVEIEAKKEAYRRGQAALKTLRSVLFALLEVGVSSTVPAAKPFLAALTSDLDAFV